MAAIEPLFCRPSWTLVNPTELEPDLDLLTVQVVHGNGVDADQAQRDLGQPYKAVHDLDPTHPHRERRQAAQSLQSAALRAVLHRHCLHRLLWVP
jgi:hypothetical protein